MAQDKSKKSLRQFQCRDYLWDLFEQMSVELECSSDYLINEAMRQYARSRNHAARSSPNLRKSTGAWQTDPKGLPPLSSREALEQTSERGPHSGSAPGRQRSIPPALPGAAASQNLASQGLGMQSSTNAHRPLNPKNPAFAVSNRPTMHPQEAGLQQDYGAPARGRGGSQVPARGNGSQLEPRRPPLYVLFQGRRIPITSEDFLIGRGSKTADLSIKDGNISRRHAVVVFQDGAYYIKDLGSTNGVEYRGQRIDIKRIEEGDVFNLCEYELRFTFR